VQSVAVEHSSGGSEVPPSEQSHVANQLVRFRCSHCPRFRCRIRNRGGIRRRAINKWSRHRRSVRPAIEWRARIPRRHAAADNTGIFPYSNTLTTFGFNGRFIYARAKFTP
jgi:hypothetical protein